MRLRIVGAAEREALKAAFRYDKQKAGLGGEFLSEVDQGMVSITSNPQACASVDMNRSKREVRCFLINRFPYAIYFEIRPDEIVILAVAHTSRRPFYWKRRK